MQQRGRCLLACALHTLFCVCWQFRSTSKVYLHNQRKKTHLLCLQLREELGPALLRGLDPPPRRSLAGVNRK